MRPPAKFQEKGAPDMPDKREPLLLLDNSTMYVIGAGDYHSTNLSFEEAKAIIDMYSTEDILRCFTDRAT